MGSRRVRHEGISLLNIHWKDCCWSWNSNTLATWCEELTHLKRPWCWERLKAGGEGDERGWDVWMASLAQWTWVWVNSGSWWWTGRPGVLRSIWSQRHDWAELRVRFKNHLTCNIVTSLTFRCASFKDHTAFNKTKHAFLLTDMLS